MRSIGGFHAPPLLDPAYVADPYPTLAAARCDYPVFHAVDQDLWVVTRYDDVKRVLQDPVTFSSANVQRPVNQMCPAAIAALEEGGFDPGIALVATDAPDHGRRRRYLMKALEFTPRRLERLESRIKNVSHEMIDSFVSDGSTDLVARFTSRLPARIIYDIIGFPEADHEQLLLWCLDRLRLSWGHLNETAQIESARAMAAYWRYCKRFVASTMADPPDNATGDLIRFHRAEPDKIAVADIEDFLFGLVFAGQETTASLMAGTLLELLSEPELWRRTAAEPQSLGRVLEEGVRFISPINAWRRITTRPVSIGGVDLPAGAQILLHIGSANRDDTFLPGAGQFQPDRNAGAAHLAFGSGPHFCIGAPLARLEARLALASLMQRLPELRLAGDFQPTYIPNVAFRVLSQLRVEWPTKSQRQRN